MEQLTRHKVRWGLVAITLVMTGVDWMARPVPDTYSLTIAVLHCVAIVAVGAFPRIGGLSVMFVEMLCCFSLPVGGPSRLWGDCLSLGVLTYAEGTASVVVLGTVGYALLQMVQMMAPYSPRHTGLNLPSSVFLMSVMLIAALLGYAFRRVADRRRYNERRHQRDMRELAYEHQEQQLRAATRMHDFVAGKLANVIMRTETGVPLDSDARREVHDEARTALDELHAIIEWMQHPDHDEQAPTADGPAKQRFVELCSAQDRRLAALGMEGRSSVKDWGFKSASDRDRIRLAADLINELYVNIEKYSDGAIAYQMNVALHNDHIEIIESNHAPARPSPTVGGKGLAVYAQRISHVGGELSYGLQDGEWSCYALIPLNGDDPEPLG